MSLTDTSTHNDHAQVLEGLDLVAMDRNSTGSNQASKFGYSTQLISNWYLHVCQEGCCPDHWSEFSNQEKGQEILKARNSKIPIIHQFIYDNKQWITESISVQDPSMRHVLGDVLEGYQDLDMELENWTFRPPFMPLVHRWDDLKHYQKQAKKAVLKNAASVLLSFLAPILTEYILARSQTQMSGKIKSQNLWQIFPPGSLVCTKFYGVDTICRVIKYHRLSITGNWEIDIEYVDWNGDKCGFNSIRVTIGSYAGTRWVKDLPVFPLNFLPDDVGFKAATIERGRKFEKCRGCHYMRANGTKILLETRRAKRRPVAGRVCVDAYAYYQSLDLPKPHLRALSGEGKDSNPGDIPGFTTVTADGEVEVMRFKREEDLSPLTEEQLLLTSPWLKGFDLKAKHWCELRVDELQDMDWNDEAFEKLILSGNEKDMAWEFVKAQRDSNAGFDDFIPDKRRGLIILMFGPPGVGKTFTAEAIAERSRVPLYTMSAGDLGTKPHEVEKSLQRALKLCKLWDAMLLLDEADVFLSSRKNDSIVRNELVSVFLRMLEYYQGILFLTTNQITDIDHAFRSRIDLVLPYHNITRKARRQVWENFIDLAGRDKFDIDGESLDFLALLPLNGREIKNLVKSAQLFSFRNDSKVSNDLLLLAERRAEAIHMLAEIDDLDV
ncbi:P-loop containing nucleoside triphosphate hydrolase protein [Biscogniauxia marginata]|nr:P-loop containing nucleoside triphosphate hydrolase protein [Biscogniauxia marginata]